MRNRTVGTGAPIHDSQNLRFGPVHSELWLALLVWAVFFGNKDAAKTYNI